jgi:hypothetical protein
VRSATDERLTWAECEWSGTKPDGSLLLLPGVTVLVIADGLITWSRFYLEPVDVADRNVEQAVRDVVGAT